MNIYASILFLFIGLTSYAQVYDLADEEVELEQLLIAVREAKSNSERDVANAAFKTKLENALGNPDAMYYPFERLTTLGVIDSPDKNFRIINWNVEQEDFSHKYYCYVLYNDKRKNYQFKELKDMTFGMPSQPEDILTADNWYGALYYRIIPVKKGSRTLYTVLGWDHNSSLSQLKVVDVMYVSGKSIKIGNPVFKVGKETKNRLFYEYSKKVTMFLNYEPDRQRIMMDHLSPESPSLKNFRSYYVPDLSYDALVFKGNKWTLVEDVIGVNPEEEDELKGKQYIYVKNERTGKVERKLIKKDWQNPEDLDAPAGGSEHVAVTPEDSNSDEPKKKTNVENDLDKRVKKRDRRDPNDLTIVNGKKKRKKKKRRR